VAELYEKAKNEKSLVIYAGGPVTNYEPLAREFERKFPGLTVTIEGGFSNVLNQKIEQQFKDGKLLADMVLFQTAQDFVRWKGEGRMLAFKPENFDAIDKSFKDPDGAYIVWYVGTLSYAYNTQQVKPENAPKSALDFLKPEFRGKMIACYPHDDDATLYLFHTIMQKYGDDYLEKYVANQPNWVQGHLSVSRSVAAGPGFEDRLLDGVLRVEWRPQHPVAVGGQLCPMLLQLAKFVRNSECGFVHINDCRARRLARLSEQQFASNAGDCGFGRANYPREPAHTRHSRARFCRVA